MAKVIICSGFGTQNLKSLTVSIVSPSICHEMIGPDAMILVFWMFSFKPTFLLSSFTFTKRIFSSSLLSDIRMVSSAYLRLLMFLPAILIPAIGFKSLQLALWKLRYSAVPLTCRSLLELAAESLEELSMLWNDKMCQVHCVHFLPHSRYQPFL